MRKNTWLKGALALAVTSVASWAIAADHLDSPSVKLDAASDITDLYSFVDGQNVVFALNVAPIADATTMFSDTLQYVIHTESGAGFGATTDKTDIICTFDAAQKISCWAGADEYVTGDASAEGGIVSASGKLKVFAGLRDDPFFFNLDGFNDTVATVKAAAGGLVFDEANCPALDAPTSSLLVGKLGTDPATAGGPAKDFFAGLNVLAIVVSVDRSVVNAGGPIMSVWASTNKAGG